MSAIGAVAVIYFNGWQARRRATVDLILHQKSDQALNQLTRDVYDMADGGENFAALVGDTKEERCLKVLRLLNNHEFISLGIRKKAFDEDIYKLSQCSNVLKVWNASCGFIYEMRNKEGKSTIFQDFEWLATRWKADPIKPLSQKKWWQSKR